MSKELIESKLLLNKIDEILNEEEDKINTENLKIRANALGTYFTSDYIITLRDKANINEGRRDMLNIIKEKIMQIVEGDDK